MLYRIATIVIFSFLFQAGLLHAQESPEPTRIDFGETKVRACATTIVPTLVRHLPDGRCETAWWFTIAPWRFEEGKFKLPIEVRSDAPVDLQLYRWDRSSERMSGDRLTGAKRVGAQLITSPQEGHSNVRWVEVALTRPGDYVLIVNSADVDPEGQYRVGLGVSAREPITALDPLPDIKTIPANPPSQTTNVFRNLTLSANEARFGEHVTLVPQLTDIPKSCEWHPTSVEAVGLLPTGLKLRPDSTVIEGTPRQLGTWNFKYALRKLHCTGDPTDYGDRTVSVTFTVRP